MVQLFSRSERRESGVVLQSSPKPPRTLIPDCIIVAQFKLRKGGVVLQSSPEPTRTLIRPLCKIRPRSQLGKGQFVDATDRALSS